MKRIVFSLFLIVCVIVYSVFSRLTHELENLERAIRGSASAETSVEQPEQLPGDTYEDSPVAAHAPRRKLVKLPAESGGNEEVNYVLRKVVEEVYRRTENLEKSFKVNIGHLRDEHVIDEVMRPGKYYYRIGWTVTYGLSGAVVEITPEYKISHEIDYAHRTGDYSALSQRARSVYILAAKTLDAIVTEDMSDFQKELAVHDYIVLKSEYDDAAARLAVSGRTSENWDAFTAYGILFDNKGVCQAYSEIFDVFMCLLDIECEEVLGIVDGTPHSWNRVRIDGEYYHVDVTWDDPTPDRPGEVSHAYFNLTDDMILRDHTLSEESDKECVSEKHNYFVINNLVVKSQEDFERIVGDALRNGAYHVEMRLDEFDINDASIDFTSDITRATVFQISESREQNVVTVYLE